MSSDTRNTRECINCGKLKPLTEFPVAQRRGAITHYRRICKKCRADYERRWRTAHKASLAKKKRNYYEEKRRQVIERVKSWQLANRDYNLAYQRAWYLANADRLREKQRRYYSENAVIARAYQERN